MPKFLYDSTCYYVTARGRHEQRIFVRDMDYQLYFRLVARYKLKFKVYVYAFCLMPDYIELILQPWNQESLSLFMHSLNRSYNSYFRTRYEQAGSLWRERFTAQAISDDRDLVERIKNIEFSPVRAAIARSPVDYPWSSCSYRVLGGGDGILDRWSRSMVF